MGHPAYLVVYLMESAVTGAGWISAILGNLLLVTNLPLERKQYYKV